MTKLTESSGTVLYESGNKIFISKRPGQWTTVFLFVTGLLAIVLLGNAILQFTVLKDQITDASRIGTTLLLLSLLFIVTTWRVWGYRRKLKKIPLEKLKTIAVIDLEKKQLLDGHELLLSPLQQTWITRRMQVSSSSPELIIQWEGGQLSIAKGNPFSGGIGPIEKVLVAKGLRKK